VLKPMENGACLFSMHDEQCNVHCVGVRGRTSCTVFMRNNEKNLMLQAICPELAKENELISTTEKEKNKELRKQEEKEPKKQEEKEPKKTGRKRTRKTRRKRTRKTRRKRAQTGILS